MPADLAEREVMPPVGLAYLKGSLGHWEWTTLTLGMCHRDQRSNDSEVSVAPMRPRRLLPGQQVVEDPEPLSWIVLRWQHFDHEARAPHR
mmetsp:Transcript_71528/g.155399  ORF Transcript_71528/g.155399 Transcript_71528/m.155399 type:complete len:90 (-) Transcript_71528:277-546(-)